MLPVDFLMGAINIVLGKEVGKHNINDGKEKNQRLYNHIWWVNVDFDKDKKNNPHGKLAWVLEKAHYFLELGNCKTVKVLKFVAKITGLTK